MKGYGIPRRRDGDVVDNLTYGAPSREMKMRKRKSRRRRWKKKARTQAKQEVRDA